MFSLRRMYGQRFNEGMQLKSSGNGRAVSEAELWRETGREVDSSMAERSGHRAPSKPCKAF